MQWLCFLDLRSIVGWFSNTAQRNDAIGCPEARFNYYLLAFPVKNWRNVLKWATISSIQMLI